MADNKNKELDEFFQCLGEIWRDVTAIEFLMRCAIAQAEGDKYKLPRHPYLKGAEYVEYPRSFALRSFSDVVDEFVNAFPQFVRANQGFWALLVDFRNAMAHGVVAEIGNSGVDELIKFKPGKEKLVVEYALPLEMQTLRQLRQSFKELRCHIMNEARDQP
jgi:hypothetical protein